jgi:hypothetical protein
MLKERNLFTEQIIIVISDWQKFPFFARDMVAILVSITVQVKAVTQTFSERVIWA